jgi:hypothetical protein
MAGRKSDPKAAFRMQVHEANHYLYAATVTTEYRDGKRIRRYTHWGTLSRDLVFTPNIKFVMASQDLKEMFIFPKEWDVSLACAGQAASVVSHVDQVRTEGQESRPSDVGLLHGSVWFLLQLAEKSRLTQDLMETFDQDESVVKDILTLAIYSCITGKNYDRLALEQRITKYPSDNVLSGDYVARIMQAVTEQHRAEFCRRRIARHAGEACLVCPSETESARGRQIAAKYYGSHRNNADLEVLRECVGYCGASREPVYYHVFPGSQSDAAMERAAMGELVCLGAESPLMVKGRELERDGELEGHLRAGHAFAVRACAGEKHVARMVSRIRFDAQGLPEDMVYDRARQVFHTRFVKEGRRFVPWEQSTESGHGDESYGISKSREGARMLDGKRLACELFLDPTRRLKELIEVQQRTMNAQVQQESQAVAQGLSLLEGQANLKDHGKPNEKAMEMARAACGFTAYFTYKAVPFEKAQCRDSSWLLEALEVKTAQQRYYERMGAQLDFHVPGEQSEDGKAGREFVIFLSLILESLVKEIWSSSEVLRERYRTPMGVLDEMADIRIITKEDGRKRLTAFLPRQEELCRIYGIEIP